MSFVCEEDAIDEFWSAMGRKDVKSVAHLIDKQKVDPSMSNNFAVRCACLNDDADMVFLLLKYKTVDPSAIDSRALWFACQLGNLNIVKRLLEDERVDPGARHNLILCVAFEQGWNQSVIDIVLNDKRIDSMSTPMPIFNRICMIRSRATSVCIGLQDLQLPALVTLKILDALIPNNIRMAAKWDLIVVVKHFHD